MNYIKLQVYPIGNLGTKFEIDNAISNFITSSESQEKEILDKDSIIKRNYLRFLQNYLVHISCSQ